LGVGKETETQKAARRMILSSIEKKSPLGRRVDTSAARWGYAKGGRYRKSQRLLSKKDKKRKGT